MAVVATVCRDDHPTACGRSGPTRDRHCEGSDRSDRLSGKLQWALVAMTGEAVVPTAWFTFAAAYAGYDGWLRPRVLVALWVVPALTVLLAATNGVHGLVWAGGALGDAPDGAYLILKRAGGPWLFVHGAYSYLVAAAGVVVIVSLIERSRPTWPRSRTPAPQQLST